MLLYRHQYTAVKAPNGEVVVAPNCLECHAQVFDGKLCIGLGNSMIDFTDRKKLNPRGAAAAERIPSTGRSTEICGGGAFSYGHEDDQRAVCIQKYGE
jgi:hypothetical protein